LTVQKQGFHTPPQETPAGLETIYSNLSKSKTDLFNSASGWGVSGPSSSYGRAYSVALPFTPTFNSAVQQVRVAVSYAFSGANQVNLSIYSDADGAPGTLLAGPVTVTDLPDIGTCCTLAVASFPPVAVSAGAQYWVAADAPLTGLGSDFAGGWAWVITDIPMANDNGFGWNPFSADGLPAGEVLGTVAATAQTGEPTRTAPTTEKSAIPVPPQALPAGLKEIYSNLGSRNDLYFDTNGWFVSGPDNADFLYAFSVALPFTPASNSTVLQVRAAVQYYGSGANQVNLSIYDDASGAPGTLLAGPVTVTNLPSFGTCCSLAIAYFSPVPLTGGTQYWVVANAPAAGTGSNFAGIWDDVARLFPVAFDSGAGWVASNADGLPAGEVLGTIP
jgi:hypothetical protein